jgi:hypothetical protein
VRERSSLVRFPQRLNAAFASPKPAAQVEKKFQLGEFLRLLLVVVSGAFIKNLLHNHSVNIK